MEKTQKITRGSNCTMDFAMAFQKCLQTVKISVCVFTPFILGLGVFLPRSIDSLSLHCDRLCSVSINRLCTRNGGGLLYVFYKFGDNNTIYQRAPNAKKALPLSLCTACTLNFRVHAVHKERGRAFCAFLQVRC